MVSKLNLIVSCAHHCWNQILVHFKKNLTEPWKSYLSRLNPHNSFPLPLAVPLFHFSLGLRVWVPHVTTLSFHSYINITCSGYFHQWNINRFCPSFSTTLHTLSSALYIIFISCIDYCNFLIFSITHSFKWFKIQLPASLPKHPHFTISPQSYSNSTDFWLFYPLLLSLFFLFGPSNRAFCLPQHHGKASFFTTLLRNSGVLFLQTSTLLTLVLPLNYNSKLTCSG